MRMLDWFRGAPEPAAATFHDVLKDHDLVAVVDNPNYGQVVVVSERPGSTQLAAARGNNVATNAGSDAIPLGEIGTTSPSPFLNFNRQEYNTELQGMEGLRKYDMMRRGDATVRSTLRLVKTPVLGGRWFIKPEDPESKRDQNAADFVWCCLTEYMSISWTQVLTEALLMCDFGYYMFEKVWEPRIIDGQQRMVLKKLAPRHPMDVRSWKFDSHGGPAGVYMNDANYSAYPDGKFIPIEKLLVFTFDQEAGNIAGISLLRSAYKHWYYKDQLYKIDAIQKERHGIGIPIIKLPVGWTPGDRITAENLGRNLRTNERAHVVLPPMWDLVFAKLEGQPVNALESIQHHDDEIAKNILALFLNKGGGKDDDQVMFLKATRFLADVVCDVFNLYLIPQLIDYNFTRVGTPKLAVRRIGEQADWRTLSFAVRNLIGAGVIRPDDKLEEQLRDEMDLPAADLATVRIVQSPQMPGGSTAPGAGTPTGTPGTQDPTTPGAKQSGQQAGLPRQNPQPVVAPPAPGAGTDRSGG